MSFYKPLQVLICIVVKQVRVCFAGNITRHPAYRHYLKDFPVSDKIMEQGFLLGAHHGLNFQDIDRVCDLLIRFDKNIV